MGSNQEYMGIGLSWYGLDAIFQNDTSSTKSFISTSVREDSPHGCNRQNAKKSLELTVMERENEREARVNFFLFFFVFL